MSVTSISTLRRMAETKAADGHISATDAKALVKAAGKGATAVKNLDKILDQFGPVFSAAGKAEMLKAIGASEKPTEKSKVSEATHRSWPEILAALPDDYVGPALRYPGVWELLDVASIQDAALKSALEARGPDGERLGTRD